MNNSIINARDVSNLSHMYFNYCCRAYNEYLINEIHTKGNGHNLLTEPQFVANAKLSTSPLWERFLLDIRANSDKIFRAYPVSSQSH